MRHGSIGLIGIAALVLSAAHALALGEPPADLRTHPTEVTLQEVKEGFALADTKGMTLYVYDQDLAQPGKTTCTYYRHCQNRWPPLLAPADAKAEGDWTIVARPEGGAQWAYKGRPLYTYLDDLTPGSLSGDNAGAGRWHAVVRKHETPKPVMPAGFQVSLGEGAWVYADFEGRVIYAPARKNVSCDAQCRATWKPVQAPAVARPIGTWTIVDRDDGIRQWALDGAPLYTALKTPTVTDGSDWTPARVNP